MSKFRGVLLLSFRKRHLQSGITSSLLLIPGPSETKTENIIHQSPTRSFLRLDCQLQRSIDLWVRRSSRVISLFGENFSSLNGLQSRVTDGREGALVYCYEAILICDSWFKLMVDPSIEDLHWVHIFILISSYRSPRVGHWDFRPSSWPFMFEWVCHNSSLSVRNGKVLSNDILLEFWLDRLEPIFAHFFILWSKADCITVSGVLLKSFLLPEPTWHHALQITTSSRKLERESRGLVLRRHWPVLRSVLIADESELRFRLRNLNSWPVHT